MEQPLNTAVDHSMSGRGHLGWSGDPILEHLGDLTGTDVVVIGAGAIDTMCALIRAGCATVTETTVTDRCHANSAEIAVVPHVAATDDALRAIGLAFRALLPGGRIVMCDPTGSVSGAITAALGAKGFSAVRVRITDHGHFVHAERPIFGRIFVDART
jgi:hypothetical protein